MKLMKTTDEVRRENLALLVDAAGGPTSFAARIDRSQSQVSQWLNASPDSKSGKPRTISSSSCRYIERAIGKPDGWMDQQGDLGIESGLNASVKENPAGSLVIPVSSAWGSMGIGAPQPDYEAIVSGLTVSMDWVRGALPRISHPSKLAVLTAFGQSMEPTLDDGDAVIVDRGVTEIREDGVFVIALDGELYIKRVQRRLPDRAIIIKSDNPHYEPMVVENGDRHKLEILGRVVWVWKGVKL